MYHSRLTNEQLQELWDALITADEKPSKEDIFKILEKHDGLRRQAVDYLLGLNLSFEEQTSLFVKYISRLLYDEVSDRMESCVVFLAGHEQTTQDTLLLLAGGPYEAMEIAIKRLLAYELNREQLWKLLYHASYADNEDTWEIWNRLCAYGIPPRKYLLENVAMNVRVRQAAARLLLTHRPENAAEAQQEMREIMKYVPELHAEMWRQLKGKQKATHLLWLLDYLSHHYRREWAKEHPSDPRRERWIKEAESYEGMRRKVGEELLTRFPTGRSVLATLVAEEDKEIAIRAGRMILAGTSAKFELIAVMRHLPELRADAWAAFRGKKLHGLELREVMKLVPELAEEAEALLRRLPRKRGSYLVQSAPDEPETAPQSRNDILRKLLDRS